MRQFIDGRLKREAIGVIARCPQRSDRYVERDTGGPQRKILDEARREVVGVGNGNAVEVFVSGKTDEVVVPCSQSTLSIQGRCQIVVAAWAVEVVLYFILARPHHFHWSANLLRDHGRLDHVIGREPPPKSTAATNQMDGDILGRDSDGFGNPFAA